MTETLGTLALNPCQTEEDLEKGATVLPHLRVKIRENEICVKGKSLFHSYLPSSEEPGSSKWHSTGDRGTLDAEGRLHLSGRLDKLIITGGEKVDPQVVEHSLLSHPQVTEALVIGQQDPHWGQQVIAFVKAKEAIIETQALRFYLKTMLPAYMIPKRIVIVEALPIRSNGKIDHKKVAQLAGC